MKEHLSGSASPTERTMAWLREQGYTVEKVEQRITKKVTRDFMGFADVIALRLGDSDGALAVQATSGQHVHERVAKIVAEPRALLWLQCGNRLWVVGWVLTGAAGRRKVFQPRVLVIEYGHPPTAKEVI